jgi:hypothetical protein
VRRSYPRPHSDLQDLHQILDSASSEEMFLSARELDVRVRAAFLMLLTIFFFFFFFPLSPGQRSMPVELGSQIKI